MQSIISFHLPPQKHPQNHPKFFYGFFREKILKLKLQTSDENVSEDEFSACLANCRVQGEPFVSKAEALAGMFSRLDTDKNGLLDKNEFTMRLPEDHDEL